MGDARRDVTGKELREMFVSATAWLEQNAAEIDSLNVFPVPDGDTGTNMLLTMRSSLEAACRCSDGGVGAVAQAIAHGALMGGRGNSGVILSQIFKGLSHGFQGKQVSGGGDWAHA